MKFKKGDRVVTKGEKKKGKPVPGTIVNIRKEGTLSIHFDDIKKKYTDAKPTHMYADGVELYNPSKLDKVLE